MAETNKEYIQRALFPLHLEEYSFGGIENPASEAEFGCEPVDKGAKADPLYRTANDGSKSLRQRSCLSKRRSTISTAWFIASSVDGESPSENSSECAGIST